MKKLLILSVLALVLFGCGEDDFENTNKDELGESTSSGISIDGSFDRYGVSVWAKESEIVFTDKYSYIDTVLESRIIQREVKYYRAENENVKVTWSLDGQKQTSVSSKEEWKSQENKWLVTNIVSLNVEEKTKDLQIEAIVELPDSKVRRFKTVPSIVVNKEVCDAFDLTFGSQKEDIHIISYVHSPQFSAVNNHSFITLLEFAEGRLVRIYCQDQGGGIQGVCEKCKIPNSLEIYNGIIQNVQEWNNGKLSFKTLNFDADKAIFGESIDWTSRTYPCLVIEKL